MSPMFTAWQQTPSTDRSSTDSALPEEQLNGLRLKVSSLEAALERMSAVFTKLATSSRAHYRDCDMRLQALESSKGLSEPTGHTSAKSSLSPELIEAVQNIGRSEARAELDCLRSQLSSPHRCDIMDGVQREMSTRDTLDDGVQSETSTRSENTGGLRTQRWTDQVEWRISMLEFALESALKKARTDIVGAIPTSPETSKISKHVVTSTTYQVEQIHNQSYAGHQSRRYRGSVLEGGSDYHNEVASSTRRQLGVNVIDFDAGLEAKSGEHQKIMDNALGENDSSPDILDCSYAKRCEGSPMRGRR